LIIHEKPIVLIECGFFWYLIFLLLGFPVNDLFQKLQYKLILDKRLLTTWMRGSREGGSREQGAGSREQGAGSREQGAGSREQGAGSREQGAGSKETVTISVRDKKTRAHVISSINSGNRNCEKIEFLSAREIHISRMCGHPVND
jgi:hypothetical protein